ncbi:MAG TPA: hypothetical protein VF368_08665 [Gemmatimonadaceae bacterium]
MRRASRFAFAAAAAALVPFGLAQSQDANRAVAGGGISVQGWMGTADGGASVNDGKFDKEGNGFHITTGPATTYWNAANKASGNYTVKATFTEAKFQNLNDHPHPYGIVIAGNDMGSAQASYLYCAVNGNGSFIVRGMGPAPFRMNGGMGATNAAVHKASAKGETVTNEVALSVKGDKVECAMNGTVVASYPKADLVAAGKLKSTDGVYGLRSAHNTEVTVTGLNLTKQ